MAHLVHGVRASGADVVVEDVVQTAAQVRHATAACNGEVWERNFQWNGLVEWFVIRGWAF